VSPTEPATTDLTLRPAGPEDAVAIADLYTAARVAAVPQMPPARHTNAEDREWMAARLAGGDHEAWVATLPDGRIAGYALLSPVWLDHLFIEPDLRGSGIGTVLLDLVKSLRPHGFSLWVFESNAGARRFYARHGLVELERTDGSANEEQAPDVRMAWPGGDPLTFFRRQIDEVDEQLGDLLARRAALTRVVQDHKRTHPEGDVRDPEREARIAAAVAARVPELGPERVARIVHAIITESVDAARER
jgi:chorismate mutase/GNAT superfamily N-acetyltransferase